MPTRPITTPTGGYHSNTPQRSISSVDAQTNGMVKKNTNPTIRPTNFPAAK